MRPMHRVRIFTDKYPFIGPVVWMLSIQYFIIQIIVALAWKSHFSIFQNTISDLGNTVCGTYGERFVCSPLHNLMNASFIMLGITMALGALLIYQEFKKSFRSLVGFSFMALAGVGTLVVGLFPENTISSLHVLGASMPFLVGNLGLVLLGVSLNLPKWLRYYTIISGIVALLALSLFITQNYIGLGAGGMERLTAYPQTVWLIIFGSYISHNHFQKASVLSKLQRR